MVRESLGEPEVEESEAQVTSSSRGRHQGRDKPEEEEGEGEGERGQQLSWRRRRRRLGGVYWPTSPQRAGRSRQIEPDSVADDEEEPCKPIVGLVCDGPKMSGQWFGLADCCEWAWRHSESQPSQQSKFGAAHQVDIQADTEVCGWREQLGRLRSQEERSGRSSLPTGGHRVCSLRLPRPRPTNANNNGHEEEAELVECCLGRAGGLHLGLRNRRQIVELNTVGLRGHNKQSRKRKLPESRHQLNQSNIANRNHNRAIESWSRRRRKGAWSDTCPNSQDGWLIFRKLPVTFIVVVGLLLVMASSMATTMDKPDVGLSIEPETQKSNRQTRHIEGMDTIGVQQRQHQHDVMEVRIGALFEDSSRRHELANVFIRTIKMINERSDETIRRLFEPARSETMRPGSVGQEQLPAGQKTPRSEMATNAKLRENNVLNRNSKPNETQTESSSIRQTANDRKSVGWRLEGMIQFLEGAGGDDSLEADRKVCQLIEAGALALVGPREGSSIAHVQSICDNKDLPYFDLKPLPGSSAGSTQLAHYGERHLPTAYNHRFAASGRLSQRRQVADSLDDPEAIGGHRGDDGGGDNDEPNDYGPPKSAPQAVPGLSLGLGGGGGGTGSGSASGSSGGWGLGDRTDDENNKSRSGSGRANNNIAPEVGSNVKLGNATGQQQQPQSPNEMQAGQLNLYPAAELINHAYIGLISAWNWSSFAIVYEEPSSMIKLQDLFRESSGSWTSKWQIKLFQFQRAGSPGGGGGWPDLGMGRSKRGGRDGLDQENPHLEGQNGSDLRESDLVDLEITSENKPNKNNDNATLERIQRDKLAGSTKLHNSNNHSSKQAERAPGEPSLSSAATATGNRPTNSFRDIFWRIKRSGETNILLDVKTERLGEALKQAQQVGCMTERYSFLITSLDLHTIDLEDFKYSRTRLTGLSLLDLFPSATETGNQLENYLARLDVLASQSSPDNSHDNGRVRSKNYGAVTSGSWQDGSLGGADHRKWPEHGHLSAPRTLHKTASGFIEPLSQGDSATSGTQQAPKLEEPPEQVGAQAHLFDLLVEQQIRSSLAARVRLSTAGAILHDSLLLLAAGLQDLASGLGEPLDKWWTPLSCSPDSPPWPHGLSLVNYMRRRTISGLTGRIQFDGRGRRSGVKLNILAVSPNQGLIKIGEWISGGSVSEPEVDQTPSQTSRAISERSDKLHPVQQLSPRSPTTTPGPSDSSADHQAELDQLNREFQERQLHLFRSMLNRGVQIPVLFDKELSPQADSVQLSTGSSLRVNEIMHDRLYRDESEQVDTLIVTTKLSQPYFMLKETPNKLEGNDQYEGFAVDLIHELSRLVNFRYRWQLVPDRKYGSKVLLENGSVIWNGMIGEIVRGQADLAIVDLTITAQREEAVDFTLPFMNTGISILFKKPTTKVTTLFSFLSPFSSDVWAYVLAAYCGISANLFLVGHLSPYEWSVPHQCRHSFDSGSLDRPPAIKNQFSLLNAFWFTMGSLMQQGSDLTPRSMSTRTIAGIWYFFTLIMISSYTANLAAFLTVEKVVYPIENVRDLSQQQEIRYGCVESGSTCNFFHDSQIDTYKKIDEMMSKFKSYVKSNDDGQKRVEEGKFAFFMESTSIEYIVERNCNLTQIGGLLDSKGYGLATSKKSRLKRPYRTLLSEGILRLQETGMLHVLKNRWWKERRGGGTCTDDGKGGGVTDLSLANVGGVFVVLLGGLGISFLVAIGEFMWRAHRNGASRDRMCDEMMSDLKFALACKRSMKPARKRSRSSEARSRWAQRAAPFELELDDDDAEADTSLVNGWRQPNSNNNNNHLGFGRLPSSKSLGSLGQLANGSQSTHNNAQSGSGKPCDPILLHAMLTMLGHQDRPQEQPIPQHYRHHLASDGHPPTGSDNLSANPLARRPHDRQTAHIQHQRNQLLFESSSVSSEQHQMIHNGQQQQQTFHQLPRLETRAQQKHNSESASSLGGGKAASSSRSSRRRQLIHQQQEHQTTIDTCDDNYT